MPRARAAAGIKYLYDEYRRPVIVADKIANIEIFRYIESKEADALPDRYSCDVRARQTVLRSVAASSGRQYAAATALWRAFDSVVNVSGRNFISAAPTGDRNYEY